MNDVLITCVIWGYLYIMQLHKFWREQENKKVSKRRNIRDFSTGKAELYMMAVVLY